MITQGAARSVRGRGRWDGGRLMSLIIATEDVHVVVAAASVFVQRGEFWDSAQAVVIAATNSFTSLPNGTTVHRLSTPWSPS
jgi:hypothetical protein